VIEHLESRCLLSGAGDLVGDTPATAEDLGVLTAAQPLVRIGTIDEAFDLDFFQFQPETNGTVTIDLGADHSSLDTVVTLFDSSGTQLANNDDFDLSSTDSQITFGVVAGENYFVSARGFSSSVGAYDLNVSIRADVGDTIATATDLGLLTATQPLSVSDTIEQALDRDVFQFQVDASGLTLVELNSDIFSFLDTVVTVFDASGNVIASNDDIPERDVFSTDSVVTFLAEGGVSYFVEARGLGTSIGDYRLSLTLAPDLGPLTFANPLEVSDVVESQFDRDVFEFQAQATGTVLVELNADSSSLDPFVAVLDSSGATISFNDDIQPGVLKNSRLAFATQAGDTYFVVARGFDISRGAYRLNLALLPDVGDTIQTAEDLGHLTANQPLAVVSVVNQAFDRDVFQFQVDGTGSTRVELSRGSGTLILDPFVTVLDSSGNVIASDDDSGPGTDSRLTFVVEQGATYFVEARGYGTRVGEYHLNLTLIPEVGDSITTAQDLGTLTDSQPLVVEGVIDQAGDLDLYSFQVSNSGSVLVRLAANFGLLDSFLTVLDSSGQVIGTNNDSTTATTDSALSFSAVQGETYFVEARGVRDTFGEFQLSLTIVNSLGLLTAAQPLVVHDVIDPAFDRDQFQFQTEVSGPVVVELSADSNSSLDTYVTIRDSNGYFVASNDDIDLFSNTNSRATFNAVAGETYTVEARGYGSSVGAYSLRITLLQDVVGDTIQTAEDLGPLTTEQPFDVLGQIEQAGDRDVYQFQADTSGSVLVQLSADSSGFGSSSLDTVVTVLDSSGNLIARNDDISGDFFSSDSQLTFAAVAGATYFVVAEGFSTASFGSTGGYSLHLEYDVGFDPATATNLGSLTETRLINTTGTITQAESVTPGSHDLFLFTAATTGTVEVRQTSAPVTGLTSPFYGVLQAFRVESGIPITTDFGSSDTTIPRVVTFSVVAGQRYFAEVTGFGSSVGDYQLQLSYVRDDVPAAGADLAFTTGSQTIVRPGSIEVSSDIDTYRLAATNRDRSLQIALNAATGSLLDSVLTVRLFANASDTTPVQTLTNDDFGSSFNSFLAVPVPAGQRLEIDAKGFRTSRGAYVLTITSANGIAAATPIVAGTPAFGSIETPFSTDVFQFTPNQMGTAIIDVTGFDVPNLSLGALGDPLVTIRETSTGNFVAFDDDSGPGLNSLATFSVRAQTSYDVVVGGFGSSTGNYRVTLNLAGGTDDASTFAQATPLSLGNTPNKDLFSPSDVDVFRFDATFNGTLNVVATPVPGSNLQVGLSAFQASPTGNAGDVELLAVPRASAPGNATDLFLPVTQGRTYFFRVAGLNNQSGGYSLDVNAQVDRVAGGLPSNDPTAPQPGEIPIVNGLGSPSDPSALSIDFPNDRDWYRIVSPAPGVFTISLNREFNYQDPLLTVYSDTGLPLVRNDDIVAPGGRSLSLNSQLTLHAVRAGEVFFVEAADLRATPEEFSAHPGRLRTYQLDVQFAPQAAGEDDYGNDPGHISPIPQQAQSPGRFTQQGILETSQDHDFYSFRATVGGTFNVQLATDDSAPLPADVQLQVFELEGADVSAASLDNLIQIASSTTANNGQNGLSLSNLTVPRTEGEASNSTRTFVVVVSHVGTTLNSAVHYSLNVNVDQGNSTRDLTLQNAALFALLSLADGAAARGDQNAIAIRAAIEAAMNELGKSGNFLVVLLDPVNEPVLTDLAGRQTGFMSSTGTLNGAGGYASVGTFGQVLIMPFNLAGPGSATLQFAGVGSLNQAMSSFSAFTVTRSGTAPVSLTEATLNNNGGGKSNFVVQLGFGTTVIPNPNAVPNGQVPSFFTMNNVTPKDRRTSSDTTTQAAISDATVLRTNDSQDETNPESPNPLDPKFWGEVLDGVLKELQIEGLTRPSVDQVLQRLRDADMLKNSSLGRSAKAVYEILKNSAEWFRSEKPTAPSALKPRVQVPKVTQEMKLPKHVQQSRLKSRKVAQLGG
jgi:hypothetical protein